CVCVCVCVCVCMCVCVCVFVYACVYMGSVMCMCMYVCSISCTLVMCVCVCNCVSIMPSSIPTPVSSSQVKHLWEGSNPTGSDRSSMESDRSSMGLILLLPLLSPTVT